MMRFQHILIVIFIFIFFISSVKAELVLDSTKKNLPVIELGTSDKIAYQNKENTFTENNNFTETIYINECYLQNGSNCFSASGTSNLTEHTLNGTYHTGNLSSNRVIKDSGTSFIGLLLDEIIDYFYDNYYNSTIIDTLITNNISTVSGGGDSIWDSNVNYAYLKTNQPQATNITKTYYNNSNYIEVQTIDGDVYIDYY